MGNLYERWKRVVKEQHDRMAINDEVYGKYLYCEIDSYIENVRNVLISEIDANEQAIGIYMPPSVYYWVAAMAVVGTDKYFVPIDTAFPEERINNIIMQCNIKSILTCGNQGNMFLNVNVIDVSSICAQNENEYFECDAMSKKWEYVIFTSGSTGVPKGVIIRTESLYNLVDWFGETYDIDNETRLMQMSNISFDVSIEEFFGVLLNGGILFIPNDRCRLSRKHFEEYINLNKINMIQMVPSLIERFLCGYPRLKTLKKVIVGAEALSDVTKDEVIKDGYKIFNHYGPTEATVDALVEKCSLEEKVNIGFPIKNTICYVIDQEGNIVSENNVIGELVVEGIGVAEGYINNSEETKRKFSEGRFNNKYRAFRTGDLVRKLKNGKIEYIGRIDNQIKIKGKRIEIEEIESVAQLCDNVRKVVVLPIKNGNNTIIALFWEGTADCETIEIYLKKYLPEYMLPVYYRRVDEFILTRNGKIDYDDLRCKFSEKKETCSISNSLDDVYLRIVNIIADILEVEEENVLNQLNCDMQLMGIDSLIYMQILVEIETCFDMEFDDSFLDSSEFESLDSFVKKIKSVIGDITEVKNDK